jgi:hypothetical protein
MHLNILKGYRHFKRVNECKTAEYFVTSATLLDLAQCAASDSVREYPHLRSVFIGTNITKVSKLLGHKPARYHA